MQRIALMTIEVDQAIRWNSLSEGLAEMVMRPRLIRQTIFDELGRGWSASEGYTTSGMSILSIKSCTSAALISWSMILPSK